jgi:hypothetical protein
MLRFSSEKSIKIRHRDRSRVPCNHRCALDWIWAHLGSCCHVRRFAIILILVVVLEQLPVRCVPEDAIALSSRYFIEYADTRTYG